MVRLCRGTRSQRRNRCRFQVRYSLVEQLVDLLAGHLTDLIEAVCEPGLLSRASPDLSPPDSGARAMVHAERRFPPLWKVRPRRQR
jgi:hypothetical protein